VAERLPALISFDLKPTHLDAVGITIDHFAELQKGSMTLPIAHRATVWPMEPPAS
jgi:hypothetical protein